MTDKADTTAKHIIIEGVTEEGKTFRPSDWAERMCGALSTFRNQRIYYSPMLQPASKDGNKCIIVDPSLQESNPELYRYILEFAETNRLKVGQDIDG